MIFSSAQRRGLLFAATVALLWISALAAFRYDPGQPAWDGLPLVRPEFAGTTGVNLDVSELTGGQSLDLLMRIVPGVRWVRFTLPWDEIEPLPGRFQWDRWDALFAALAARAELVPVVVLDRSPQWARPAQDADNPLAPPHERRDFGAFAAAVAARYGSQVRYYQIWHEPNIAPHWGTRTADPADYMGLLREAAVQIRAVDRDAQIVLASLAPTVEKGGANLSDVIYLDQLYRLGGRAWFDVVAGQPYGFSDPPDAPAHPEALNFSRISLLRQVMVRHGDGETPLWATSFGWNAPPQGWAGPPAPWGQVLEAAQVRYTAAALAQARTNWPWLGPLFWPALCPRRPADDPWLGFALCAQDGAPRPVAAALSTAGTAPDWLSPGRHVLDHPALRFSPGWRVTPWAADPKADGDTLTFDFWGSGLALRVQGGPYWAYYVVTVDGAPAGALPRDEAGRAYLVLHDPPAAVRWVSVAQNLAPGRHTVRLETVGGWGQWALQGLAVSGAPYRSWWPGWLLVALAALATAVRLAWGWAGRGRARTAADAPGVEPGIEASAGPAQGETNRLKPRFRNGRLLSSVQPLLTRAAAWPDVAWWAAAIAFALLLVLSRSFPLDLAALAGLGLVFLVRPDLSLPFIAAALPFWQQPKPILGWEFGHFELFLWVAIAALAARWVLQPAGVRRQGSGARGQASEDRGQRPENGRRSAVGHLPSAILDHSILALLLSGLASTLVAAEQGVAWREFRIVFLFGAAFYVLITRMPWPVGRAFSWRPLVFGLLAGMAIASLIGLGQLVTGQGRVDVEGVWRVRALYGSPNNLALVLDRGVPLALALAFFGTWRYGERGIGRRAEGLAQEWQVRGWRSVATVVLLLLTLACVATFSKGGLLLGLPAGTAVVLIGGAWRSGRRWPLWALAGLIVLAVAGMALLFRTPRFADLFNFEAGTSFLRLKLWHGAWNMALDHPLLGVGPDNFLYAYRTRYVLPSAWEELNLSHPHNILLDLWTRLGLIGVVAGGWALVTAFRAAWRRFQAGDVEAWPLALGLLAGLVATVAHGLIDNWLFLPDLMGLFVVTVGLLRRMEG
ncbi:MAG: O-antigen ligase family protein [Anaerolineae bacterium]